MPDQHGDNFCPYDLINPDGSDFMAEYGAFFNNNTNTKSPSNKGGNGLGSTFSVNKLIKVLIALIIIGPLCILITIILALILAA